MVKRLASTEGVGSSDEMNSIILLPNVVPSIHPISSNISSITELMNLHAPLSFILLEYQRFQLLLHRFLDLFSFGVR